MPDLDITSILSDDRKAVIANGRLTALAEAAWGHKINRDELLAANAAAAKPLTGKALELLTEAEDDAVKTINVAFATTIDSVKDLDVPEHFEAITKGREAVEAAKPAKPVKPAKG